MKPSNPHSSECHERRLRLAAFLGDGEALEQVEPIDPVGLTPSVWNANASAGRRQTPPHELGVWEGRVSLLPHLQVLEFGGLHHHTLVLISVELTEHVLPLAGPWRRKVTEICSRLRGWLAAPDQVDLQGLHREVLTTLAFAGGAEPSGADAVLRAAVEALRVQESDAPRVEPRRCAEHAMFGAEDYLQESVWQRRYLGDRLSKPGWGLPPGAQDTYWDLAPFVSQVRSNVEMEEDDDAIAQRVRALLDGAPTPTAQASSLAGEPEAWRWLQDQREALRRGCAEVEGEKRAIPTLAPVRDMLARLLAAPDLYELADYEWAELGSVRDAGSSRRRWTALALVARLRGAVALGFAERSDVSRLAPSTGWKELTGLKRLKAHKRDRCLAAWAEASGSDRTTVQLNVAKELLARLQAETAEG